MFYIVTEDPALEVYSSYQVFNESKYQILDTDDCVVEEYYGSQLKEIAKKVKLNNYVEPCEDAVNGAILYSMFPALLHGRLKINFGMINASVRLKEQALFTFSSTRDMLFMRFSNNSFEEAYIAKFPIYLGTEFKNYFFSYAQVIGKYLYFVITVMFSVLNESGALRVNFAFVLEGDKASLVFVYGSKKVMKFQGVFVGSECRIKDRSLASKLMLAKYDPCYNYFYKD